METIEVVEVERTSSVIVTVLEQGTSPSQRAVGEEKEQKK